MCADLCVGSCGGGGGGGLCLGSCMGGTVWECCVGRSYAWVGCAYRAVAQHCAGELCEGSRVEAVWVNCGGS